MFHFLDFRRFKLFMKYIRHLEYIAVQYIIRLTFYFVFFSVAFLSK